MDIFVFYHETKTFRKPKPISFRRSLHPLSSYQLTEVKFHSVWVCVLIALLINPERNVTKTLWKPKRMDNFVFMLLSMKPNHNVTKTFYKPRHIGLRSNLHPLSSYQLKEVYLQSGWVYLLIAMSSKYFANLRRLTIYVISFSVCRWLCTNI